MNRFGSIIVCTTLASGLLACGSNGSDSKTSSTKSSINLAPTDNTVPGWVVEPTAKNGNGQPMVASSHAEAEALIDGAAAPFYKAPFTPKQFLWQNYVNDSLPAAPKGASIVLYIWTMPSADQASGLYRALLQESEYSGNQGTPDDWQATSPVLGTESRIEDTRTAWWINFFQDVFYVEVMLSPSFGPGPDYTPANPDLKQEVLKFARAIANKM